MTPCNRVPAHLSIPAAPACPDSRAGRVRPAHTFAPLARVCPTCGNDNPGNGGSCERCGAGSYRPGREHREVASGQSCQG